MQKMLSTLFLITMLFTSSCSTFYPQNDLIERDIANSEEAPLTAEELFSFKKGTHQEANTILNNLQNGLKAKDGILYEFIESSTLPKDVTYKFEPAIVNEKYTFKIYHTADAALDFDASVELIKFISMIHSKKVVNPYSTFELTHNAKAGDVTSLHVLAKMRKAAMDIYTNSDDSGKWKERMAASIADLDENLKKFETLERKINKQKKLLETTRRELMDKLDKAPDEEQFRSMVAKNDRKGVVQVIRNYLPWEEMAPFEKKYWEHQLAVMADPLPLESRISIYRGIDDDMIQVAIEDGVELTKEEAIREQKIFLMSSMMTKNQGTWNRRLRSLTTMNDKFIGTDTLGSNEYSRAFRITTMFSKHSDEPKGSPFLSLTPNFGTAASFGSNRNTLFLLDPRLISFNFASSYANEAEFLLPLVTFPDDLGAVYDRNIHGVVPNSQEFLIETTKARLEKELGKTKAAAAWEKIKLNTTKFNQPISTSKNGALQSGSDFFKKNLGLDSAELAKKLGTGTEMPCMDLIQLFW